MQVNNIIKSVAIVALMTGAVFVSTSSFAKESAKHAAASKMCKEKFSDTKSKDYRLCVKEAMKAPKK